MLEVSVLGAVTASVGGTQRPIGGPKQRTLLARLVIAQGRTLSPSQLFDDLSGRTAPRDPARALHMRVSRLRSAQQASTVTSARRRRSPCSRGLEKCSQIIWASNRAENSTPCIPGYCELRIPSPCFVCRLPAPRSSGPVESRAPIALSRASVNSNGSAALSTLLQQQHAVLLTGPAGIGKTHLLRSVGARFETRQCLAPILTASPLSRSTPLGVFAGAFNALPGEQRTPASVIDFYARHRSQTVVLVDNVDQLDTASLFVITQLIRTARVPAILTSRVLTRAPQEIRALYDSGALTEVAVDGLTRREADEFVTELLGGTLTPDARPAIFDTARGNPLSLRELITGSVTEGRLKKTAHGWELVGDPALTPRLAQLVGERYTDVKGATLEAAIKVAIAGEYPDQALDVAERRQLAQAEIVEPASGGWLRLSRPADSEYLRTRSSALLWQELAREVMTVLGSVDTAGRPHAQRRAHTLALDFHDPIDPEATIAVAENALAHFDERLALRAATAVICQEPANVDAHRIAGQAASAMRLPETAEAHFETARGLSQTDVERTRIALARAHHHGVYRLDAVGALEVIDAALGSVDGSDDVAQLRIAHGRWTAVAGMGREPDRAPAVSPAVAAPGLLTAAMAAAITGPLDEATQTRSVRSCRTWHSGGIRGGAQPTVAPTDAP